MSSTSPSPVNTDLVANNHDLGVAGGKAVGLSQPGLQRVEGGRVGDVKHDEDAVTRCVQFVPHVHVFVAARQVPHVNSHCKRESEVVSSTK